VIDPGVRATVDVRYRFSGFSVDPVRRLLFGPDGQPIAIKPRVFDTLLYLVEHRGELLEKQALLDAIWPNVVVEENNLNQAISTLRRVFGETRGENSFIVTEPGRGYRFVAPVETVAGGAPGATPPASMAPLPPGESKPAGLRPRRLALTGAAALLAMVAALVVVDAYRAREATEPSSPSVSTSRTVPSQSVAVLPFSDLSESGDRAWLVDGVTEEILNSLAQLPELTVSARTSSFQFRNAPSDIREIAERLGVAHVLEGSVRLVGEELRVTAQLVRAEDGFHVWSNTYEGSASELLDFQREVAERVASALDVVLDERLRARMFGGGTRSVEAFEAYQEGWRVIRDYAGGGASREWDAIPHFERALRLDPRYALAALGKAGALNTVLLLGDPASPYSQAEALEQMRDAYGFVASNGATQTMRLVAEIHLERLSPTWHRMQGLLNRLREERDFNVLLLSGEGGNSLPGFLFVTNQHDIARAFVERQVAIDPLNVNTWIQRSQVERHSGNIAAARNVLAEARQVVGREGIFDYIEYHIARKEGNRDEVIAYLGTRRDPGATMLLAAVRGDYDTALRMADDVEAMQRPPSILHTWLVDTYYEIGATERLQALVKRIDESPQGTPIFMFLLNQAAGFSFDLADAPTFAAQLEQAGLDPATYLPPLPRLSAAP
jgi:TolB-like protein/DNA-binding winged helix-turn-helix (wHTH) protein